MDMQQGFLTLFIEKNFGNVVSTNPTEFQAGSPGNDLTWRFSLIVEDPGSPALALLHH